MSQELKAFLDLKVQEFNRESFIAGDPVSVPHAFTRKEDIEIAGLIASTLAWGQRVTIISNALKLIEMMDGAPFDFITGSSTDNFGRFLNFVHRTFNGEDCIFLVTALRDLYLNHGGAEAVFNRGYFITGTIAGAIDHFRSTLLMTPHLKRSEKHIADPSKGSAAKRINMFLRWMVRDDGQGVDFGIWKTIRPADLMCPLDVHSGRVARKLGLLSRKQNDWKAVEELTANLRIFDPEDPVKYDFAIFGLGVFEKF